MIANGYHLQMNDEATPPGRRTGPLDAGPAAARRRTTSAELFRGARELVIDHDGRTYQLRITQNGKLILTA